MEMSKRVRRKALGDLVVAVDRNYIPMMEVSRRHALKALVTERAEVLDLATWGRLALYEILDDLHSFKVILYPSVQAIADSRIKLGKGYRGILERDNHTCQYCGGKGNTVDHIIPKSRGGSSSPSNLVAACLNCNQKKANKTPEEANMPLAHQVKSSRWRLIDKFNKLVETSQKV